MLQVLKQDIEDALTPDFKRTACDDATAFVNEFFSGIVKDFAILLIAELKSTIKG